MAGVPSVLLHHVEQEATQVGVRDPEKVYEVGGALASLRKVIEVNPAPTLPGQLTS